MIKIFATDKVKELDQYTIQHEPISSIDLVERAATTFVHEFCRRYSKQVRIVIFAGQGLSLIHILPNISTDASDLYMLGEQSCL